MTILDLNRLAESLTAPQFEQLLRLRLKAAFATTQSGPGIVMLVASSIYGKANELGECLWHIGHHGDQTKGELLDDCIIEHNRRVAFTASNKLLLIEGTSSEVEILPADAPSAADAPSPDNIPF